MSVRWHVHLAGGQKVAWALDEDLRWVRRALGDRCRWSTLPPARIVHAAWPAAVNVIPPRALRGKTVVCQADNPPAFYLGTDGFAAAAGRVDLWIARSGEALCQFHLLGLPAVLVPYCVDPSVFRRLQDREAIRRSLGIGPEAFVIGNFHRDSEGADLTRPKMQKGADIFFEIARELARRVPQTTVLLAGPRRHWLLNALRSAGIEVIFAGREPGNADDYTRNILSRERLNELYQALDVCVVSSRWEGGPYSVLEALAAGASVISSPVGTARDVLPDACKFHSVSRAVDLLEGHARGCVLNEPCAVASDNAARTHSPESMRKALLEAYEGLPKGGAGVGSSIASAWSFVAGGNRPRQTRDEVRLAGAVSARAKEIIEPVGLINFDDHDAEKSLVECAAQIAAARMQKHAI